MSYFDQLYDNKSGDDRSGGLSVFSPSFPTRKVPATRFGHIVNCSQKTRNTKLLMHNKLKARAKRHN